MFGIPDPIFGVPDPDPPIPASLATKNKDPPKKARISLPAEPLKSLEKRAKTHQKARENTIRRKQGKRKKQGLEGHGKRVSLLNPRVRTKFVAFPLERTRKEPRSSVRFCAATGV